MADDAHFLDALARGDQRAAAACIVREYGDDVLSLCRAMVGDEALAEDLTQDTYQRAIAGLSGFRAEASPKTWLKTIARHLCIDHLRRAARRPDAKSHVEVDAVDAVDAAADDAPLAPELLLRRDAVQLALGALDEQARALVVLRFSHDVGYPELADAFGQSQGALRMRISRALASMREQLEVAPTSRRADARRGRQAAPIDVMGIFDEVAGSGVEEGSAIPAASGAGRGGASGAGPVPVAAAPMAAALGITFAFVLGQLGRPASARLRGRLDALVAGA